MSGTRKVVKQTDSLLTCHTLDVKDNGITVHKVICYLGCFLVALGVYYFKCRNKDVKFTQEMLDEINSQIDQLCTLRFRKDELDYLRSIQNPATGLWGEGVNYNTVSALMKVAPVYNSAGTELEYAKEALRSCIDAALSPELSDKTQITFIYNPWCAINSLRQILEKQGTAPAWFDEMLYDNAAQMIRMTKVKLAVYKKSDGGFSYMPNRSSAYSQGAPASLGTAEGDVNATTIAINGVLRNLNQCLGLPHEAAYGEEAVKRFAQTIAN